MAEPTPAATLVLVRPGPAGPEVAWVHRARGLRFLGDFWAFPGGTCDGGEAPPAAALREALEEVGLLLGPDGPLPGDVARAAQADLLAGRATWPALLARAGVDAAATEATLMPSARWVTPPFGPLRFDAHFYVRVVPRETPLHVVEGELDRAEWLRPQDALDRWARDEALVAPPTRFTLEALAGLQGDPREPDWAARAALAAAAVSPEQGQFQGGIDFRPGLRLFPVRTPTLPPATHTNCYIIGDGSEVVVIDAASPYDDERARLDRMLDALCAGPPRRRVRELLLTHHHHDHTSGAEHLARRLGVPIAAHRRTAAHLEGRVKVDRFVEDGEVIDLPGDLPGSRPRRLVCHLTEGHADGHLVFFEAVTRGAVAGDMVAGTGTIVVDPPEGDMFVYLESLKRLRGLDAAVLYPAHGPPIGDPARFVDEYVAHRLAREAKVLAAVQAGAAPVDELVPRAYTDVKPQLWPLAARSLLAHLLKLEREGAVAREGEVWRVA